MHPHARLQMLLVVPAHHVTTKRRRYLEEDAHGNSVGAACEQGRKHGHVLEHCIVEEQPHPGKQHHVTRLLLMQRLYLGLMGVTPVCELCIHPPCVGKQPKKLRGVVPRFHAIAVANGPRQQKNRPTSRCETRNKAESVGVLSPGQRGVRVSGGRGNALPLGIWAYQRKSLSIHRYK